MNEERVPGWQVEKRKGTGFQCWRHVCEAEWNVKLLVTRGRETSRQPLGAMFSRAGLQAQWRNAGEHRGAGFLSSTVLLFPTGSPVPAGFRVGYRYRAETLAALNEQKIKY
jgi:hypothetical protein